MEQQASEQPLAIFVSEHRNLHVAIAPEEHGFGLDVNGRRAVRSNVRFKNGRLEVQDQVLASILRKHQGNRANGGKEFQEIAQQVLDHGRELDVSKAGELTDADRELMARLRKRCQGVLPPKLRPEVTADWHALARRFNVNGLKGPKDGDGSAAVQVRVVDLLEFLEEHGLDERAGNPE